jgi:hypothetical protein
MNSQSSNSHSDERRHFSRIVFDGDTCISQGERTWPVTLLDLSLKGLLIEEPKNWNADNHQPFQASIQLNEDTTINMSVNWRHTNKGQMGFECTHIDIDSISHLRRLVELNLGDDSLLERELAGLGNPH